MCTGIVAYIARPIGIIHAFPYDLAIANKDTADRYFIGSQGCFGLRLRSVKHAELPQIAIPYYSKSLAHIEFDTSSIILSRCLKV